MASWTVEGASTITQQLAKNLYLSPSRNPFRKVKEAVLAKRLEWALSKDRILELYLNVAEFGPGIWGVEAASQEYFNKPASRLTRSEAAALAAVLPVLAQITVSAPSYAAWVMATVIPRSLNDPLGLSPSYLKYKRIPAPGASISPS